MSLGIIVKRRLINLNWLNIQNPSSPRQCVFVFLLLQLLVFLLLWLLLSEPIRRFLSVFRYAGSTCSLDCAQSPLISLIWSCKARGQNPRRWELFLWACLWTSRRLMKRSPKLQQLHGQAMKRKSFRAFLYQMGRIISILSHLVISHDPLWDWQGFSWCYVSQETSQMSSSSSPWWTVLS